MTMALQAKSVSAAQLWIGKLAIAAACGGVALAVCVLPNLERGEYLKRWSIPLAGICFLPSIATVAISRWAIDRTSDYNEGYNDGRNHLIAEQQQGQYVQYQQPAQQLRPTASPAMAAAPAMGPDNFAVRDFSEIHPVPVAGGGGGDNDDFVVALFQ
jgi:hypothetical protein